MLYKDVLKITFNGGLDPGGNITTFNVIQFIIYEIMILYFSFMLTHTPF